MLFLIVSFFSSIVGAICGIGGGVIIKPVLDMLGMGSATTISFLSGCTVLSMSAYSVGKGMLAREKSVDMSTGTPLAIGAALGGMAGKQLFSFLKSLFANPQTVGAVQAAALAVITVLTLLYTLNKEKISTKQIKNPVLCALIGLVLGVLSSFLGIGGGPINLVVLYYFFSMETKVAAANSLYIILFSQAASLIATLVTRSVPEFAPMSLVLMVCGGIGGGILGRVINKKIDSKAVEKLFVCLIGLIIFISIYNTWNCLQG